MADIAKIAIDLATNRLYDYRVPEGLRGRIAIGTPVLVPFGRVERRGFVVALADHPDHRGELKEIGSIAGKDELIRGSLMELAKWMARYYLCPIELAVRAVLPGAVRRADAGFLERLIAAPTSISHGWGAKEIEALAARAPKQAEALKKLLEEGEMLVSRISGAVGAGAVRALAQKGLIHIHGGIQARNPHADEELLPTQPLSLMPQQVQALEIVRRSMDTLAPPVVLLHGVTGSGKTEVYLQAIQYALDLDRGAIVLVPEIALTPQTVERFRGRFGDVVAVLHSSLSEGERHDEWHRIHSGRARIAVGARSALFAPVDRLGLIVVDEEHEPTYKQEEAPRYHARDVAVMRGRIEKCAVLLGSATPALESWNNARLGRYALVTLPARVDHRAMPEIQVLDLRQQFIGREQKRGLFAPELVEQMRVRVERAEQVILFLNRRGYARSLTCPQCGETVQCGECSVPMTLHKHMDQLLCHICGKLRPVPQRCPNPDCGNPDIRLGSAGTERIEETLRKLFPKTGIARMDSDTMKNKEDYRRVLSDFRAGIVQILIGTQMIAKGLHFPNVTLVGVVNADTTLMESDFRAGERTLQLLTQVAGRAGRGEIPGDVFVQTFAPFHPAIQAARRMDFVNFCDQELEFRKQLNYPPFFRMIALLIRGKDEAKTKAVAERLHQAVLPPAGEWIVADVQPAVLARAKGEYRFQILLRGPRRRMDMTESVRRALAMKCPNMIHISADVDPVSIP